MRAATVLLALSLAAQPAPAALTDQQLEAVAREAATSAASAWSVPVTFTQAADGFIRSMPSGELKVPIGALRDTLAGLPEEQWGTLISWLMAHEVWHQLQYRAGFKLPAPPEAKRLFECEADVMAAMLVTNAVLRAHQGPPSDDEMQAFGRNLKLIMTAMEKAEAAYAGVLDHPKGEVRQMAIRAGAGRATFERVGELASAPEDRALVDRLGTIHDIKAGEAAPDWAKRTCRLMLHEGDGAASLVLGTPDLRWNKTGDPPIVDYVLPFKNRGTLPIRVTVQVRSASVPRAKGQSDDITRWTFADARTFQFDLQPGVAYQVGGRFDWYATEEVKPRLLYPGAIVSFYDAELLEQSAPASAPQVLTELPADLLRLKNFLNAIYLDGPNRYKAVAPPCPREELDRVCPFVAGFPGAIEAEATREADGSNEVYLLLYEGNSEPDAASAYSAFLKKLLRIYPSVRQDSTVRPNGSQEVNLRPDPRADMRVVKRQRKSGEQVVEVWITPDLD